ncbi:MAG: E3 binding domain-containing protein, partial [Chloroflexi bacterium]|nr:E3 binding domain-containing protein [Chloroflexota bacterium]
RGSEEAIVGRIKAAPLARRLAADSALDLSSLSGSGPAGRIVKRDVEAAIAAGPAAAAGGGAVPTPVPPVFLPSGEEFEDVPLSQMRKTIARRLTESIGPVRFVPELLAIERVFADKFRPVNLRDRVRQPQSALHTPTEAVALLPIFGAHSDDHDLGAQSDGVLRRVTRVHTA